MFLSFHFSVQDCKERWKNLRGSYTRHLKYINTPSGSAAKKKKPYYLAEYMTFLLPFTKSRTMKSNIQTASPVADSGNSDSELDNNDELSNSQYEEGLQNEAFSPITPRHSSYTPDSFAPASEVTRASTSNKVSKKSRMSLNKSGPTLDDVNKSAFQYFENKKASNQITSGKRQIDEDPDVLFLLSLLPDIKKMNDNQKRRYKIEMLTSAGNILDEKAESTSSPDNVHKTGETNGFTLPPDTERTAGGLIYLDRVTKDTDLNYLSEYLRFPK